MKVKLKQDRTHCMACGMPLIPNGNYKPKTFCDKICGYTYQKNPDQFGYWWKKPWRYPKEPEYVNSQQGEPKYVLEFNFEKALLKRIRRKQKCG